MTLYASYSGPERQMLAAYASSRPPTRLQYTYARIKNVITLIIHIPYSAGFQYFPFSTISYELFQYTINRKHLTIYRNTQMELSAFNWGMARRRKNRFDTDMQPMQCSDWCSLSCACASRTVRN
ncbi:hypothetical protein ALC62_04181 [Cyphomyrmex costatus]|uniref:Uncharacterized protein n=1 Tax=Cyphomyrmex costatus TaxID=456900 RepID=A0A195CW82_9HYME|nr:hypothetical protein ALC62_04181 [Cyphomyrmex costatus]